MIHRCIEPSSHSLAKEIRPRRPQPTKHHDQSSHLDDTTSGKQSMSKYRPNPNALFHYRSCGAINLCERGLLRTTANPQLHTHTITKQPIKYTKRGRTKCFATRSFSPHRPVGYQSIYQPINKDANERGLLYCCCVKSHSTNNKPLCSTCQAFVAILCSPADEALEPCLQPNALVYNYHVLCTLSKAGVCVYHGLQHTENSTPFSTRHNTSTRVQPRNKPLPQHQQLQRC